MLRPLIDGETRRFIGWIGGTYTMRYHVGYASTRTATCGFEQNRQPKTPKLFEQIGTDWEIFVRWIAKHSPTAKSRRRRKDFRLDSKHSIIADESGVSTRAASAAHLPSSFAFIRG